MNRMIDNTRRQLKRKAHIRKKISGTPERPRMTVFRSNLHMYVQVIDDTCGKTLVSASTVEADLRNLRNTCEDALKLGEIVGKRILDAKIESVVFDRNGYVYHGIVKSIADGARKAGVKF